jgi:hypothetical protein
MVVGAPAAVRERGRPWLRPAVTATLIVVVGVVLVALTLREPTMPSFEPTPPAPREVGPRLVGPVRYTVDATGADRWRHFSFRLGSVVEEPGARDWDLAFRRYFIIANGGPGFAGRGGIRDLGERSFAEVTAVPDGGYEANTGGADPTNPAIARWYRYGFFSHLLTPRPHVWAVRTADGRYAKLEIVGYYCTGGQPGCLTFRYVYQGDGSTAVAAP